jgi:hypothetical protein
LATVIGFGGAIGDGPLLENAWSIGPSERSWDRILEFCKHQLVWIVIFNELELDSKGTQSSLCMDGRAYIFKCHAFESEMIDSKWIDRSSHGRNDCPIQAMNRSSSLQVFAPDNERR